MKFKHYTPEQDIELEFDYQPYEEETRTYPGCDAKATLCGVWRKGEDITEEAIKVFGQDWVAEVEEEFLDECAKQYRWDNPYRRHRLLGSWVRA